MVKVCNSSANSQGRALAGEQHVLFEEGGPPALRKIKQKEQDLELGGGRGGNRGSLPAPKGNKTDG